MIDDSSLATVSVVKGYDAEVTKNSKVKASSGVYIFNDFILTSEPNNTVLLNITSNALDQNIISNAIPNMTTFSYIISMKLRYCTRGEYIANSTCKLCGAGTYSLYEMST